jgi:short-subunit dehydrogenase
MGEHLDVVGLRSGRLKRGAHRVHHALGLVARRARRLRRVQRRPGDEHRVRERAPDVDPEQHGATTYSGRAQQGAAAR